MRIGIRAWRGDVDTQLPGQVAATNELHRQATRYCGQLQDYNGKLQACRPFNQFSI